LFAHAASDIFQVLARPIRMGSARRLDKHALESLNIASEVRGLDTFEFHNLITPYQKHGRTGLRFIEELVEFGLGLVQSNAFHDVILISMSTVRQG